MTEAIAALIARIRLGEDSGLELKEVSFKGNRIEPHQNSLADELAAFANAGGGTLVLGVDDKSRALQGIPIDKLDRLEQYVVNAAQTLIDPALPITTRKIELEDEAGRPHPVLRIDVAQSLYVHQSPGGYLLRVGSSKRKLKAEYLARLFQQRSQERLIRFDESLVHQATVSNLDAALWERFRSDRTKNETNDFLHKLGMARAAEDGAWHPTVAGVLMASSEPQRWLPNAFIQAVAYRGTTVVPKTPGDFYQLDAKDVSGPLDEQIVEACRFVYRNMKVGATKSLGRHDIPQFDMEAVFEAITNAVAHRDYSIHGSKIRLRLHADRMELYSPGSIPSSITVDSLPFRQSARNDTITGLLARCPIPRDQEWMHTARETFMDRRGEGVRIILDNSEKLSGKRPEYRLIDDSELMLTIFAAPNGEEKE